LGFRHQAETPRTRLRRCPLTQRRAESRGTASLTSRFQTAAGAFAL